MRVRHKDQDPELVSSADQPVVVTRSSKSADQLSALHEVLHGYCSSCVVQLDMLCLMHSELAALSSISAGWLTWPHDVLVRLLADMLTAKWYRYSYVTSSNCKPVS